METKASATAKKMKKYYARQKKMSVSIPVRDERGEVVCQRDNAGNKKLGYGGAPLAVMQDINFNTQSANPKLGYLSSYETSDPDEIKRLDELVNDAGSPIMDEATFKKTRNPEAYEIERRYQDEQKILVEALDKKDAELERLQKEVEQHKQKAK
jgi:hypothetical protein